MGDGLDSEWTQSWMLNDACMIDERSVRDTLGNLALFVKLIIRCRRHCLSLSLPLKSFVPINKRTVKVRTPLYRMEILWLLAGAFRSSSAGTPIAVVSSISYMYSIARNLLPCRLQTRPDTTFGSL